jgi:hypothetical protein
MTARPAPAVAAISPGTWGLLPFTSQLNAVHAALLRTGKVFLLAGSGNDPTNYPFARGSVILDFNASNGNPRFPANPVNSQGRQTDLFCCGHAFLSNGQLLLAGGTLQYDPFFGLKDALLLDPVSAGWTRVTSMAGGRWYPTLTTLGDGRVLAVSGLDTAGAYNQLPEIYSPGIGWAPLARTTKIWPMYAHLFLLQDGRIFYAGGQLGSTKGLTPCIWDMGTNTTTPVGGLTNLTLRNQSASVLLPPAQAQRVMIIGGGPSSGTSRATNACNIVDLKTPAPAYQPAAPLRHARMHHNAVLLPDRTVFVCGGSNVQEDTAAAVLRAEVYTPDTNTWTEVAAAQVPRVYHAVALLLPDGRVVSAGSNRLREEDEQRMEIYRPAYLSAATRPVISGAPQQLTYGQQFQISTAQAGNIRWISLIRPRATTHSFDMEQRLVDVPFTVSGTTLRATLPANPNLAPPGWYMLFISDRNNIPSVAAWVRVLPVTATQPPTIQSFTPTRGGRYASITLTGTRFTGTTAVRFNGVAAAFVLYSDTQLRAIVPPTATSGPLTVTTAAGTRSATGNFTVIPPPTISSFTPTSGPPGTTVTLTGTNLTGATAVRFTGTPATSFTVISATQVKAAVPAGATSGKISVTTPGGTGSSSGSFQVR